MAPEGHRALPMARGLPAMSGELSWNEFLTPGPDQEPDEREQPARARRRLRSMPRVRRRRWVAVAAVVAVLAAAGGVAFAATDSGSGSYRTATVKRSTVEQTLDSTGTVSAVNRANLSFPVSGTVDSVSAKVGQQVRAGQTLATLSDASLQQQVLSAKSSLASAEAKLAADQTSETTGSASTASSGGGGSSGSSSPGSVRTSALTQPTSSATTLVPAALTSAAVMVPVARTGSGGSGSASSARSQVEQAQSALTASVSKADGLLTQVRGIIGSEQSACSSFLGQLSSRRSDSATVSPSVYRTSASTSSTRSSTGSSGSSSSAGSSSSGSTSTANGSQCASLINQVLNLQDQINDLQQTVKAETAALNTAVSALLQQVGSSMSTGSGAGSTGGQGSGRSGSGSGSSGSRQPGSGSGSGSSAFGRSGSSGSGSSGTAGSSGTRSGSPSGSGGGRVATAEDVAADQASVDAATLQVAVAEQAERQAQLVSPIDGTVGLLNLSKGSAVSGSTGSSSPSIVVVGPGGYEVSTTVTDLDLDHVKVGSLVHATPDETGRAVDGTVTSIGVLPTSSGSSSSSTTGGSAIYPVTIALSGDDLSLHTGTSADTAIVLAQANAVLTVPTSAIHRIGSGSIVEVVRGGKESAVRVTLGAVGRELTQVTSGLQVGEQVVLANMNASIPSSTSSQTGRGFGGTGFGGGAGLGGGAGTGRTGGAGTGLRG